MDVKEKAELKLNDIEEVKQDENREIEDIKNPMEAETNMQEEKDKIVQEVEDIDETESPNTEQKEEETNDKENLEENVEPQEEDKRNLEVLNISVIKKRED